MNRHSILTGSSIFSSLLLFVGVLHPIVAIDSSALEAKFGCSELSVLANEIKRRDDARVLHAPSCPVYTEITDSLDANNGDVDLVLRARPIFEASEIAPIKDECKQLEDATKGIAGGGSNFFIYEETAGLSEYWSCPETTHKCVANQVALQSAAAKAPSAEHAKMLQEIVSTYKSIDKEQGPKGFISVDHTCLEQVINDVIVFQEEFDASDLCQAQTMALQLNSELRKAFDAIEVGTAEDATTHFVDYLDTAPSSYASICQGNGGTHVKLNLEVDCRGWEISSSAEVVEQYDIKFMVANRPRCYSVGCTPDDDVRLMEEFTFRETEKKWESETQNTFWVCQGQVVEAEDQADFSVCSVETAVIGEVNVVKSTNNAIVPDIEQKKGKVFFFFSVDIENEYVATFANSTSQTAAYESRCIENDGNYSIADDFVLQCVGGGVGAQETLKYEVSGFPVCLSSSCTTGSEEDRDAAEASLMAAKLELTGSLSSSGNYECSYTMSGASSLISLPGMLSLICMVGGSMWFL